MALRIAWCRISRGPFDQPVQILTLRVCQSHVRASKDRSRALRRKREKTIFYSDTVQTNQKTMWTHNFSVEKIDFSVSNVWSNDTCPIIREKREMSKMPLTHEQIHVILAIKQIKHWKLIKEIPCVMYWMPFENVCCKSKSYKEKELHALHSLCFS